MAYLTIQKTKLGSPTDVAKIAGSQGIQFLYNILRVGPKLILRSAYELMRANTITRILSAIVLLSVDTISFARRHISLKQYIINITLAALLIAGGTVGWNLGTELAKHIVLLENVVIGIIASLIGAGILGAGFGAVGEKCIKRYVQDDETEMLAICNRIFDDMIQECSLTHEQALEAASKIKITTVLLRQMFAEEDRETFAKKVIEKGF